MLWGNTRSISAALHARNRGSEYQHASCIQIVDCNPYWSISYLCSIFHGFLVVTLLLMCKWLVSKVDIWIGWESPTRTRGAGFRQILSATKYIISLFLEEWIPSKGIHIDRTCTFTCSFFSLFLTLCNNFHEVYLDNLYKSLNFAHLYCTHHNFVKVQGFSQTDGRVFEI